MTGATRRRDSDRTKLSLGPGTQSTTRIRDSIVGAVLRRSLRKMALLNFKVLCGVVVRNGEVGITRHCVGGAGVIAGSTVISKRRRIDPGGSLAIAVRNMSRRAFWFQIWIVLRLLAAKRQNR
jgi:hypothetical protein